MAKITIWWIKVAQRLSWDFYHYVDTESETLKTGDEIGNQIREQFNVIL